ncbi:MAG TPA: hypothetical protein VF544_03990 [Pyrinomonadaceae bacterium]
MSGWAKRGFAWGAGWLSVTEAARERPEGKHEGAADEAEIVPLFIVQ